ncbi:hypothetical protein [Streptomyces sp. NPDC059850]|uniref:hypothetical protein n=1 Tax=Streptomyces sp. NPDC059850 TaxID=3346970 RepID=UPI00365411D0
MSSLQVDVLAYEAPCERCFFSLWWVFGLLPSYRPRGEEFTTTDFPEAVDMARRILAAPDGDTADVAAQLHDRPPWQRGRSFNPNRCGACGHHAEWYVLDAILTRVYHYKGWIYAAAGRVPVPEWRAIRGGGQGIHWPYY